MSEETITATEVAIPTKRITNPTGKGGFTRENWAERGNPGGRPISKPITEAYKRIGEMSDEELEKFKPANQYERKALEMFQASGRNLVPATRELTDRVEGRAVDNSPQQQGGIQILVLESWKSESGGHSNVSFELPGSEPKLLEDNDLDEERK